jgi:GDP-L-fucose synthase
MKLLITGGSGFLGRHIVDESILAGYETYAPRSSRMNLMSIDEIRKYIQEKEINTIIHSAALYGGLQINQEYPAKLFYVNSIMIANLYYAAGTERVDRVIGVGSCCCYPSMKGKMKEKNFWSGPLHESVESYGFSKRLQLVGQNAIHKEFFTDFDHLVLTNLYGEEDDFGEDRGHAISILIKRICDAKKNSEPTIQNWGNGRPIREFMYVKDAAKAIVEFLGKEPSNDIYNIGTGIGTSIKDLTNLICKMADYKGKVIWDGTKPNGVMKKIMNISKFKKLFPNFKNTSLEEGLKKTIDWYIKNN